MIARVGALLVGLSLVLTPVTGLCISEAGSPRQVALPAFSGLPDGATQHSEPPNISVSVDGTIFTQSAGSSSDATAYAPNACALAAPVLIAPVGGATLATLVPQFEWSRIGERYHVQISTTSNFSVLIYESTWDIGGSSNPSVPMNFNLLPNTAYYWRVASVCEDGAVGSFSSPASFTTGNVTGPFTSAPAMTAPPDSALQASLQVTFSWGDVAGATRGKSGCTIHSPRRRAMTSGIEYPIWERGPRFGVPRRRGLSRPQGRTTGVCLLEPMLVGVHYRLSGPSR